MKNAHKPDSNGVGADGSDVDANGISVDEMLKINSMKLVRLVRGQEVLYNSSTEGYNDKNHKDMIWERIYRALFPHFDTLDEKQQEGIRVSVRRRWKTLRDSISREVKKNATVENYCRRKESPLIAELEFLIPHIRSAHCAKLTDELGLRECYASMAEAELQDDDSYNDLIDLTEEFDLKPFIKPDGFQYSGDDEAYNGEDSSGQQQEAQSPWVCINSTANNIEQDMSANVEGAIDNSINASWSKEYCTVAEFKGGEFLNPTVLCADQENGAVDCTVLDDDNDKSSPQNESRKRSRIEIDESKEVQAKILQLLSNLGNRERVVEHDGEDEDRMFLLSLVSDLKRVPRAKKMLVKMEIVTAIARANH